MKFFIRVVIVLCCCSLPVVSAQTGVGQKIAIIDSGILANALSKNDKVIEELCWSRPDVASPDSGPPPGFNDLEIASLCKNGGQSDFQSVDAATLPRIARHASTGNKYANHSYGAAHGTRVYEEALAFAPGSRFIIVANGYYDASNLITFNGVADTPCGVHGPNGNAFEDGTVKPSDDERCYNPESAFTQIEVIDQIRDAGDVAAINYSAGSVNSSLVATNCSSNSAIFQSLKDDNIAFVAAAGNRGANAPIEYPACNRNVIAVGALQADGTMAADTSTGVGQIDFFASGESPGSTSIATSFAAPKVSAAFALVQSAEGRVRTVDEIRFALTESSPYFVTVNGRRIPVVTVESARAAASCLIRNTCVDLSPPSLNEFNYSDGGGFGTDFGRDDAKYDLQFDYGIISPPPPLQKNRSLSTEIGLPIKASKTIGEAVPSERDIVLRFEGRASSVSSNRIDVLINGVRRYSTPSFLRSRNAEFVIPRTMFNAGENTITLQPRIASRIWGVTNISADFTPVVPLVLNRSDRNKYGSGENPERPTGMRASFELTSVDSSVVVTANGFGVNTRDEIEVYINGRFYGNLDNGSSSESVSNSNSFAIAKDDLIRGLNALEFVQKNRASGGWGVSNVLVAADTNRPRLKLGQIDSTEYGNEFGTNKNALQLEVEFRPLSQSDHKVSWKAFDIDRAGELEILLNNTLLKNANTTRNGRFGAPETITLASRLFRSGVNTLTFRANSEASDTRWGVTDLLVRPSTVINLDVPSSLDKTYGYYPLYSGGVPSGWTRTYSSEEYQTRLNAQFDNTENVDITLTVAGWGIDSPQEVAVYLNGTFLQHLTSAARSSVFSKPDKITLPEDILVLGTNTISLRTRDDALPGFQGEKWGVKFIRFSSSPGAGAVAPVLMLLLDD